MPAMDSRFKVTKTSKFAVVDVLAGAAGKAAGGKVDVAAAAAARPKGTGRRDKLANIELAVRAQWQTEKTFEAERRVGPDGKPAPKFMVTFPYPYMNGRLHLGHAFSLTKAEFTAAFRRIKGDNVLFPFGFHCTGMPIQAAANKLKEEIATYGCPPVFPSEDDDDAAAAAKPAAGKASAEEAAAKKGKAKKGKIGTSTKKVYQWDTLIKMGLSPDELPAFAEPDTWLTHFPPLGKLDLEACVDRSEAAAPRRPRVARRASRLARGGVLYWPRRGWRGLGQRGERAANGGFGVWFGVAALLGRGRDRVPRLHHHQPYIGSGVRTSYVAL